MMCGCFWCCIRIVYVINYLFEVVGVVYWGLGVEVGFGIGVDGFYQVIVYFGQVYIDMLFVVQCFFLCVEELGV